MAAAGGVWYGENMLGRIHMNARYCLKNGVTLQDALAQGVVAPEKVATPRVWRLGADLAVVDNRGAV